LIRRLDQIDGGTVPAGDCTGEAYADGRATTIGMRNTKGFDALPKRFRNLCRSIRPGTRKHDDEFVSPVPGDKVSRSVDGPGDSSGNLPEALVARGMPKSIVVRFEAIDVEHDQ
jgi:hypothetical protein